MEFITSNKDKPMSDNDRVAIAKDVIQWLMNGKFIATHMCFVEWPDEDPKIDLNKELSIQLKETKPCNVCAKGAAFICAVDRFNEIKARDVMKINMSGRVVVKHSGFESFLQQFWSKTQINQIEAAFEGWNENAQIEQQYGDDWDNVDSDAIVDGDLYDFADESFDHGQADVRLAMIMRNIIVHDGEFDAKAFIAKIEKGYDASVLNPPKGFLPKGTD